MPPKQSGKGGKHADPAAPAGAGASVFDAEALAFTSPCFWKPAADLPAGFNVFSAWGGQVPSTFPTAHDVASFFGGGGAARSFDAAGAGAADEDDTNQPGSSGAAAAAKADGGDSDADVDDVIDVPDHRSEREQRLGIPAAIVSRASGSEDVAVNKLDHAALDTIPLEAFYKLLTETPFSKREMMLEKERQRRRGDTELFLDGGVVDVPSQYKTMLDRIFARLDQVVSKDNQQLELPVVRVEPHGRRTIWVNFPQICEVLGRDKENVRGFVCNKLTTTSKYDGDGRLHVDISRLTKEKLQKLVTDYALSHVQCHSCHGFQTDPMRDTALRLDMVVCRVCHAKRSVEAATGGFVAIANRRARLNARRALA